MMTIIYTDYYGVIMSPFESDETPYPVAVPDGTAGYTRIETERSIGGCVFCGCPDFVGDTYECAGCGAI